MQGKKTYQEKLFNSFQLSERIPTNNFYRRLKAALDLNFLYNLTQDYYGRSGQKSIDPVVFFIPIAIGMFSGLFREHRQPPTVSRAQRYAHGYFVFFRL